MWFKSVWIWSACFRSMANLFLPASVPPSASLFLSPPNVTCYISCCEIYHSTITDDGRDFHFLYIRKEELKLKKKKIIPANSGVGSCFLGNVSDWNDFSSCVLWDGWMCVIPYMQLHWQTRCVLQIETSSKWLSLFYGENDLKCQRIMYHHLQIKSLMKDRAGNHFRTRSDYHNRMQVELEWNPS